MHSAIILGIELILGIDIFGALETDASFLLFFPSQYQADNARIALSAFRHMVALEIEFEDEILGGIQCLASLAEPVAAVALCQLDNLGTDMFQESFSLFSPRISNTLFSTWKNMW